MDIILYEGDNELNVALIPLAPPVTTLFGVVTDATIGLPIPGVLVTLDSMYVYTDSSGNYAFIDLTPGTYSVTFNKPGYAIQAFPWVAIAEGANQLNVELERLALPIIDAGGVSTGNSKRRLSRFGDILYATYLKKVNGDNEVFIAFSMDGGANWTPRQVTSSSSPGPGDKGSPSIAVDNNGDLCLVYGYASNVYYDVLSGGSWLGPQQVNDAINDGCAGAPEILIDRLNNPHVFYLSDRGAGFGDWGRCYVRHGENPPMWSKTDFTQIGAGGGGARISPGDFAVAINSLDQIELIWSYAINGGFMIGWQPRTIYRGSKEWQLLSTGTSIYGSPVDIAVDSGDNIILCWGAILQYYGSTLGPEEQFMTAGWGVSVAVARDDDIYLIWSQRGATKYPGKLNLFLRRRGAGPGGIWQGGQFLTDVEDANNYPSLLWAKNPSYCQADTYAVTWEREIADQILFGSPAFFEPLIGA